MNPTNAKAGQAYFTEGRRTALPHLFPQYSSSEQPQRHCLHASEIAGRPFQKSHSPVRENSIQSETDNRRAYWHIPPPFRQTSKVQFQLSICVLTWRRTSAPVVTSTYCWITSPSSTQGQRWTEVSNCNRQERWHIFTNCKGKTVQDMFRICRGKGGGDMLNLMPRDANRKRWAGVLSPCP
jgi:hypothetical protein